MFNELTEKPFIKFTPESDMIDFYFSINTNPSTRLEKSKAK